MNCRITQEVESPLGSQTTMSIYKRTSLYDVWNITFGVSWTRLFIAHLLHQNTRLVHRLANNSISINNPWSWYSLCRDIISADSCHFSLPVGGKIMKKMYVACEGISASRRKQFPILIQLLCALFIYKAQQPLETRTFSWSRLHDHIQTHHTR